MVFSSMALTLGPRFCLHDSVLECHKICDMYLKGFVGNIYVIMLVVNLISFINGSILSWSSSQLVKLSSDPEDEDSENPLGRKITNSEAGWISSLISVGGVMGPFIFGAIMGKLGRKAALLGIGVPHCIAYVMLAHASNINVYYVARILSGIGCGGGFLVVPVYLGEMSSAERRGFIVSSVGISIIAGILFCFCVGPYAPIIAFNWILAAWVIIYEILTLILASESPYFLVSQKKDIIAEEVLSRLRRKNAESIHKEMIDIENVVNGVKEKGTCKDLCRERANVIATLISVLLLLFQQCSGINVVLAYAEQIFQEVKFKLKPEQSAIVIGCVQLLTSPIIPLLADVCGRRMLMLISCAGCCVSDVMLGVFFFLKNKDFDVSSFSWLPITCLVSYIVFFNTGFAGIPWTLIAEIFANNIKSLGSSMASVTYWTMGFILTCFFNDIIKGMGGMGPVFCFFGLFCLGCFLFVLFVVPETKGKTFSEIQEALSKKKVEG